MEQAASMEQMKAKLEKNIQEEDFKKQTED